jgi:hypothetical protein
MEEVWAHRTCGHSEVGRLALQFGVLAASGVVVRSDGTLDFSNVHEDAAPDFGHGFWPYSVP